MIDHLLRSANESSMNSALLAAGIVDAKWSPLNGVTIDRIGPCGADTRYHVNVRIADGVAYDADELPTFSPLPVTPYRVWFDG
jgi:hypothetical protein